VSEGVPDPAVFIESERYKVFPLGFHVLRLDRDAVRTVVLWS
jgi:hypothetical protein